MHDLDAHLGDLHPLIVDREIEIVQQLVNQIIVHEALINRVCDVFAELDCLLSFAEASISFNYRRPEMVNENIIRIVQGRHPLQEQIVDTFVSNDAYVVGGRGVRLENDDDTESNSVLICTGSNACGKATSSSLSLLPLILTVLRVFISSKSLSSNTWLRLGASSPQNLPPLAWSTRSSLAYPLGNPYPRFNRLL